MSDIQKESKYLNKHIEECRSRIETIQDYIESNDAIDLADCRNNIAVLQAVIAALQEKQHNDELRKRLYNIFGGDVTLDTMVDELQRQLEEPDKPHPLNAKILTYEDADKWEKWKQLEKQGRLAELPCAVGDTVYINTSMQGWYLREDKKPYKAKAEHGISVEDALMSAEVRRAWRHYTEL